MFAGFECLDGLFDDDVDLNTGDQKNANPSSEHCKVCRRSLLAGAGCVMVVLSCLQHQHRASTQFCLY